LRARAAHHPKANGELTLHHSADEAQAADSPLLQNIRAEGVAL
jgi:hypothetical protein